MTDAPIIVSELGVHRDARAATSRLHVAFGPALLLAAAALGGAVAAPVIDHHADLLTEVVRAVVVGCFALAGGFALALRPKERQPLLVLSATFFASAAVVASALIHAHAHGVAISAGLVATSRVVEPIALAILPVSTMHVLLGLPDGTCRLSRLAIGSGYLAAVGVGLGLWSDRPALPLWPVGVELLLAVPVGIVGARRRYRKAAGLERQRMQWFGWAVSVGIEVVLLAVALRLFWGWPTRETLVITVAAVPIAIAVAAGAVTGVASRIDRILAWSVSVAGLTGVVVVVYLIVILGIGHAPTKRERTLLILSMIAAAASALLYGPARLRLRAYANRVVYGEREAPDTVLRTFATRLTRAMPLEELLLQVAESLRKTLALTSAEIWTGSGGVLERAVSVPDAAPKRLVLSASEESVVARAGVSGNAWLEIWMPAILEGCEGLSVRVAPTTHSGRVLGLVIATRKADGERFSEDDDTTLVELARQLGLALHNVELDSALQESLDEVRRQADELRASRARIVAAADAARRQIERNLHDGAQQHLVALAVNVRLARELVESDPAGSVTILDQLGHELQDAVQELRALAHGIYPPLLVDRGIEEALRSAAGRAAIAAEVQADGLRRYLPEEEAAVYFCCVEALQNASKHAGEGANATIRIHEREGALFFEVEDDGAGFDVQSRKGAGAGFVNMRDRVGAVGGSLTVESAPGKGTKISGRLPLQDRDESSGNGAQTSARSAVRT
ncbi:MAG: ATP-binding protein [Acidimicrobiales bacterium]